MEASIPVPHHLRDRFDDLVVNNEHLNHQCGNCTTYDFPCLNCQEYVYGGQITPEILHERLASV